MLTDDDIKISLERSFKPYRCIVQIRPDEWLRFKVMKGTVDVYASPMDGIDVSDLRQETLLAALIIKARAELTANGHQLDPW